MGMLIDKAINRLENYYDTFCGYSDDGLCGAIYTAINTIHKYQKIQEIYERFQKDGNYYHHMAWLDVMEVLKDGKDIL